MTPAGGMKLPRSSPHPRQLCQPLRVGQAGLAPGDVLHVPGVADQDLFEATFHQRVAGRHRVRPGRLHRDMGDALRLQPLRHLPQHPVERPVGPLLRLPPAPALPGQPDRDRDHVLADTGPGAPLAGNLHDRHLPAGPRSQAHALPAEPPLSKETDTRARSATGSTRRRGGSSVNLIDGLNHSQAEPTSAGNAHADPILIHGGGRPRPSNLIAQYRGYGRGAVRWAFPGTRSWCRSRRGPGSLRSASPGRRTCAGPGC